MIIKHKFGLDQSYLDSDNYFKYSPGSETAKYAYGFSIDYKGFITKVNA